MLEWIVGSPKFTCNIRFSSYILENSHIVSQ